MKLVVVFLSALTIVHCEPATDDLTNFNLLKDVNSTFASVRKGTDRIQFIQELLQRTRTAAQFSAVNEDYRNVLSSVINFNGTKSLGTIDSWIYYHRASSLVMMDVRVEIRRAINYLTPFQTNATNINNQRSSALALPFDQKVAAVTKTLNQFKESFPVLDQISEQLDAAMYDFGSFLKEV